MTSPLEKGNELEEAVRAIETAILRSSPDLRENAFTFESKKVVIVDGVRHEIDLYVEVDVARKYKAIYIFECKNWTSTVVGKNEIVIFSEKIKVLNAQRGFFVARSFTKDAEAQAKKDGRIELLIATEHNVADMPVPFGFQGTFAFDRGKVEFTIFYNGPPPPPFEISKLTASFKGEQIDLHRFVQDLAEEAAKGVWEQFLSAPPDNDQKPEVEQKFEDNELIVNGEPVTKISMKLPVRFFPPVIASIYDIEKRGRTYTFAPISF
jgi:hypothetical protein